MLNCKNKPYEHEAWHRDVTSNYQQLKSFTFYTA